MDNVELVFLKNSNHMMDKKIRRKLRIINNILHYNFNTKEFTGQSILELICLINYLNKGNPFNLPVYINIGSVVFSDKLVYVLLESLIFYIYENKKYNLKLYIDAKDTIWTEGIGFSPLKYTDLYNFKKKFKFDLTGRHFRRLVPNLAYQGNDYLSSLMQDLYNFFFNNGISDVTSNQLAETFTELVGNASEHGGSECIIDIDITKEKYKKRGIQDETNYYGMNVAILSFSSTLFYEPLKNKLNTIDNLSDRYRKVNIAKEYHMKNLSNNYFENDFYTISSFQHKISGSYRKKSTGGTGLTALIQSLEEKVDSHLCYIISGNRILYFLEDCMKFDKDNFIGFNSSNNYFSDIPDNIFTNSPVYVPGTAYNLSFAIKKGWDL